MTPKGLGLMVALGIVLAGCGEAMLSTTPATTAAECTSQYKAALNRGGYQPAPSTGAGMIGASIGKGLGKGMLESAYQQCLARVNAAPVAATTVVRRAPTAQSYAAGCTKGGSVMQGGTGYCVGY